MSRKRRRRESTPPRPSGGVRLAASLGLLGSVCTAIWLLGYPTRPGPFEASPGYGIGLVALFAAAGLPLFLAARRGGDPLLSELKRRAPVLLIVGGIVGGLLLAEGVVRVSGRAEWGAGQGPLQPSYKLRNYKINTEGFRGPSPSPESLRRRRVLLGLGDSFTFGQGVSWEETFLQRIDKRLNEDGRLGSIVTVNAARPGWSTAQEYRFLMQGGFDRYHPQALILQFTLNDAEIQPYYLFPITPWPQFEMSRLWRSHLFFLIVKARNQAARPYEDFIRAQFADGTREWDVFRQSLRGIASECQRRKTRPLFVMFPILQDLDNYLFEDIHEKVAAEAKAAGFIVVDLLAEFRAYPKPTASLRVSPGDWHPNAEGHKIAAEAILPHLLP